MGEKRTSEDHGSCNAGLQRGSISNPRLPWRACRIELTIPMKGANLGVISDDSAMVKERPLDRGRE